MMLVRSPIATKSEPFYDALSDDYDRFVNWEARLAHELPFLERLLDEHGARRVLDAACGTGMHAIALAQRGYQTVGTDSSVGMIEQARANAAVTGVDARFVVAGFGEMAEKVSDRFDAVLCLGNSLPHVLSTGNLRDTLADFAAVLRPGGLLLIQNRNFDAVMANQTRWMDPQVHQEDDKEWLFVRFYDFNSDGTLAFNMLTLQRDKRDSQEDWKLQAKVTRLRPWLQAELQEMVAVAGFEAVACYGNMTGASFDLDASDNLVLTALKGKTQ
jgi:SAM-dependent methyltransferase